MGFFTAGFAQAGKPEGLLGFIDQLARTPLSNVVIFVAICTVLRLALFPYLVKTLPHLRMGAYGVAKLGNEILDAIIYAGVFVFLIIRPFVLQTFYIPSGSMVQTLQVQDYIIANKFVYRFSDPKFQDIVVFKPPSIALMPGQGDTDFIKRVIGTPGDVIEIKNNVLYRNGSPVDEKYKVFTKPDVSALPRERYLNLSPEELRMQDVRDFKLVEYNGEYIPLNIIDGRANLSAQQFIVAKQFEIYDPAVEQQLLAAPPAKVPPGKLLCMGDNRNGSFDSRGWGLVDRDRVIGRAEVIWFPISRMSRIK